jgi:hypothetical protein
MRWQITSESTSDANSWVPAISSARSADEFSMMPLCTTEMRAVQSRCGWALASLTAPWVAHRV